MMTMRSVHAGEGYRYLLQSVATNDARDKRADENRLHDYYAAKGTPPGRWLGSGCVELGSDSVAVGGAISALQMSALYGEGLHPDADEMIANGVKVDATRLGSRYPQATDGVPVLEALRDAERAFMKQNGRIPTDAERAGIAMDIGRPFHEEATGITHAAGSEVLDWINEQKQNVRQAVAGFDLTFSPAKSVSVLWALGDEDVSRLIAACHHEAVEETIAWAEANIVRTRKGAGGIQQAETRGIIAAQFTHFDTRAGDPDLHSHVLVSNKVCRAEDGKWRSIDGQPLFANGHNLSTRYDRLLMQKLQDRLGIGFEARTKANAKDPVWEIAGVSEELVQHFSKRRAMAEPVYKEKLAAYIEKHGTQPTDRVAHELWQQAVLATRDAKKPAESLNDLREKWRSEILSTPGAGEFMRQVHAATHREVVDNRAVFPPQTSKAWVKTVETVAANVLERETDRRSTIRTHHVQTAVTTALKGYRFETETALEEAHEAIVNEIIGSRVVLLNGHDPVNLPEQLRNADGQAIDRKLGWEKFTTQAIIDAENDVMEAVAEPTGYVAERADIDATIAEYEASHGFALNHGQRDFAHHLLSCGTLIGTGVGPAGTGKTTSMTIVADVWRGLGHEVIGLAPSAAAAELLGNEIGVNAHTIDALTHTWRGLNPRKPGHDPSALPIQLKPGDMLMVDEAGMASTKNIHALTEIAKATGAVIRMVGDPHQLDAVENGGLFAALTTYAPTTELTDVMRFSRGKDAEQAEASLKIRHGDTTAVEFYQRREWLTGGTRDAMITAAVDAYLADVERGLSSVVVASTNADVDTMNEMIRHARISAGEVDTTTEARLSRGDKAGLGDTIVARLNQSTERGRVMNGQLFTVVGITEDGSLDVREQKTGAYMRLEADYVQEHTHLGYALTVHRAQGATVDTTHALIDAATDRASCYVALTRGKKANRIYAVTDVDLDTSAEDAHFHMAGVKKAPTAAEVLEAAITRDNRQRSAMETAAEEAAALTSPDRIRALYRYGVDLAYSAYVEAKMPWVLDHLPALTPEQETHLTTVAKRLLSHGVDPFDVNDQFFADLTDARDVASVVAYRWENLSRLTSPASFPPPPAGYAPEPLTTWLQDTYETRPWEKRQAPVPEPTQPAATATATQPATEDEQAFAAGRSLTDLLGMGGVPTTPAKPDKGTKKPLTETQKELRKVRKLLEKQPPLTAEALRKSSPSPHRAKHEQQVRRTAQTHRRGRTR